jgi:hypothetical protein
MEVNSASMAKKHSARNVWDDSTTKESKEISVTLPPHGSALFEVRYSRSRAEGLRIGILQIA